MHPEPFILCFAENICEKERPIIGRRHSGANNLSHVIGGMATQCPSPPRKTESEKGKGREGSGCTRKGGKEMRLYTAHVAAGDVSIEKA